MIEKLKLSQLSVCLLFCLLAGPFLSGCGKSEKKKIAEVEAYYSAQTAKRDAERAAQHARNEKQEVAEKEQTEDNEKAHVEADGDVGEIEDETLFEMLDDL